MPLVFNGLGGLVNIVHWKTRAINDLYLSCLNNFKKLAGKEGKIDIHKQLLLAILLQHITCVDQVLHVGFCHGISIYTMLELIKKAAEGMYHPNGFDEEEDLHVLLFLHLGSAQVTDVAHHIFGTPAASTIQRRTIIPQLIASPSFPTSHEIESNIAASFKAIRDILGASMQKVFHAVIMFDKISVE